MTQEKPKPLRDDVLRKLLAMPPDPRKKSKPKKSERPAK
jgi:hypothetical protein